MYCDHEPTTDYFFATALGMWITVKAVHENPISVSFSGETGAEERITLPVSYGLLKYFEGAEVDFSSCRVDLSGYTQFQQDVLTAARSIPWGTCITYSQLAAMAGRPGAARAAGNALNKNRLPVIIPCHRVVSIHGTGGYSWGADIKQKLLRLESIDIQAGCSTSGGVTPTHFLKV